jgi:hypothetical protein
MAVEIAVAGKGPELNAALTLLLSGEIIDQV